MVILKSTVSSKDEKLKKKDRYEVGLQKNNKSRMIDTAIKEQIALYSASFILLIA